MYHHHHLNQKHYQNHQHDGDSNSISRRMHDVVVVGSNGSTGSNSNRTQNTSSSSFQNATSCSSHFLQTTHAQIRRKQRNILYKDVKAAIKYGTRTPHIWYSDLKRKKKLQQQQQQQRNGNRTIEKHRGNSSSIFKYTYNDLIYIVDEAEKKEITCYTKPIELLPIPLPLHTILHSPPPLSFSRRSDVSSSSHTIMIIDTSGSMKSSDVWGTRNRLDAVWMAIAIDFLAVRIQQQEQQQQRQPYGNNSIPTIDSSGPSTQQTMDVITIILMKERAQVLYRYVPMTWMLYNQFVQIYNQRQTIPPCGHGCYLPSLTIAEQIIDECSVFGNSSSSSRNNMETTTSLLLLSDGAPSDLKKDRCQIMDRIQSITTKQVQMGCRFMFTAIGIGSGGTTSNNTNSIPKFSLLRQMVQTARNHGAMSAQLKVPSMSCTSFGQTFSSIATSVSSTSMSSSMSIEPQPRHDNTIRGGFRTVVVDDDDDDRDANNDPRQLLQFDINHRTVRTLQQPIQEMVTPEFFNIYPVNNVIRKICTVSDVMDIASSAFIPVPCQHLDTRYIAIAKNAFVEGRERLVYQFYEVAGDGATILGVPMVAKESRRMAAMTTNTTGTTDRRATTTRLEDHVNTFCFTQQVARQVAIQFNRRLYGDPHKIPIDTPRISFLDCSVYEICDVMNGGRRFDLLVENMMDCTQWFKWNSNNGWKSSSNDTEQRQQQQQQRRRRGVQQLKQICEVDDEEENMDEGYVDYDESDDANTAQHTDEGIQQQQRPFTVSQVAQAFSHFSYWYTNGQYLICDLQGVYSMERNTIQLSDPVIHSQNNTIDRILAAQQNNRRTSQFGRTDRGGKGMDDFFMTHRCDEQKQLCQIVTTEWGSINGNGNCCGTFHPFHRNDDGDEWVRMKF